MSSKKELRELIEELKQDLAENLAAANLGARLRRETKEQAARIEREREATRILHEKRANIHKGLIPVDELRKLVTSHSTNRNVMDSRTTVELNVANPTGIQKDIVDALTGSEKPKYAVGGYAVGGYTRGVSTTLAAGEVVTRKPQFVELSTTDRQLLRDIAEGKATI